MQTNNSIGNKYNIIIYDKIIIFLEDVNKKLCYEDIYEFRFMLSCLIRKRISA